MPFSCTLAAWRTRAGTDTIPRLGIGVWRSLVARSVRVGEVPGSNPGTPISPCHGPPLRGGPLPWRALCDWSARRVVAAMGGRSGRPLAGATAGASRRDVRMLRQTRWSAAPERPGAALSVHRPKSLDGIRRLQSSTGFGTLSEEHQPLGLCPRLRPYRTDMGADCVLVQPAFHSPDIHGTSETVH